MASELGNKFSCFKCSTKFYDLKKPAPVCPKCGTDQRDQPPPTKAERKKATPKPEPVPVEAEEGDETEEDEDEDDEEDA